MKKILSLLVVSLIVMTGCAAGASTADTKAGDITTVSWLTIGDEPADLQQVQDAMNKILGDEYNLNVDFEYIPYADYTDQVGLRMASGEPMDVVFAPGWSLDFMTEVNDGLYYPLNDVMSKDFKDTIDKSFWKGVTVDDKIYAVPTDKELGTSVYALYNKAQVPDGYDVSKVDSLSSALDLSKKYYDQTGKPGYYLNENWNGTYKYFPYDCLPGLDYQVCLDVNNPDEGYKWIFSYDDYKALGEQINASIKSGATKLDDGSTQFADTDYFMHTSEGNPTDKAGYEGSEGKKLDMIPLTKPVVTTDNVRGSLNVVAASSEHPQQAMELIEAINTDERLRNLFAYGIEGVHYNLDENGEVVFTDEAKNYQGQVYTQGDYDTKLLVAGQPADSMKQLDDFNASAMISPALGFNPDLSDYDAQVANILNINDKYKAAITSFNYTGSMDEMLAPVLKEYKSVGAQDVLDAINEQYNTWKSEQ